MPVPGQARSLEDYIGLLRQLKARSGNPSITQITQRVQRAWRAAGRPPNELPVRSTIGRCFLISRHRVSEDLMVAVVQAMIGDEAAAVAEWRQALRAVLSTSATSTLVIAHNRLPAVPAGFTGREDLLRQALTQPDAMRATDRPAAITVFEGMPGVGKTTLAVRLGHHLVEQGASTAVLFVNLRGFDPSVPPADPSAVLEAFLRTLGVTGDRIPHSQAKRTALFQQLLAGTRTLIVLDNAATADQVRPLLPSNATCHVLITSRHALSGLPDAHRLPVEAFTSHESLNMLRNTAGPGRIDADVRTAAEVAEHLGHLPLALSVLGSHIRSHPEWSLADYLEPLTALVMEGGVRAALALSDRDLPDAQRATLRLLTLHPGPDIDAYAAAAITQQPLSVAQRHLTALTTAHLLRQRLPGRYEFHDLIRAYAGERSRLEVPRSRAHAALTGLRQYYQHTAAQAMDRYAPHERDRRPHLPAPRGETPQLSTAALAQQWLETELANLLACGADLAMGKRLSNGGDLALVLHRYLDDHAHYDEAMILHTTAVDIARGNGDRLGEVRALLNLGTTYWRLGRYDDAIGCHHRALASARQMGDRVHEGRALTGLGLSHVKMGNYSDAIELMDQALTLAVQAGNRVGESHALGNLGIAYGRLGRYDEALDHHQRSLAVLTHIGNRAGESYALSNLGNVYGWMGDYDQALKHHQRSLTVARETGNRSHESYVLTSIGAALEHLGRYDEAADYHRRALALCHDTGDSINEGYVMINLGSLCLRLGQAEQSLLHYQRGLAVARETADRDLELKASIGVGDALRAAGKQSAGSDVDLRRNPSPAVTFSR